MEGEDWVAISNTIPRRGSKDCYSRWRYRFKQSSIIGEWSAKEDHSLISLRMDGKNWDAISQEFPGRDARTCKEYFEAHHPDLYGLRR